MYNCVVYNHHVEQKYALLSFYRLWFNDEEISLFIFIIVHGTSYFYCDKLDIPVACQILKSLFYVKLMLTIMFDLLDLKYIFELNLYNVSTLYPLKIYTYMNTRQ